MGTKTGIVVGFLDVAKGFIPAILFTTYVGPAAGDVAGFAAVLGHITSPWLRGRGGKGVSTTLGAILGTHPLWLLTVLPVFLLGVFGFRRVGMASVAAAITLIITAIVFGDGWANVAFGVALGLLVLFRHRRNIVAFIKKPLA
jgi:glycerol-3-phosphate acyltransferase PlsY